MAYVVKNSEGVPQAGDPRLDEALTEMVDNNPGFYIVDESTGEKVYG